MKKNLLIFLLLMLSLYVKAQDSTAVKLPVKDGKVIYEGIVDITNKSKTELYKNASQWFVDFFKSSKDVIQNSDKEEGRIVGKGIAFIQIKIIGFTSEFPDLLTIQVDVKDNKYRYRIYDMQLSTETQNLNGFGTLYGRKFTAEDLISNVVDGKHIVLTKSASKKTIIAIDEKIKELIHSLNVAMNKSDSF